MTNEAASAPGNRNWTEKKAKLMARFSNLTDADLEFKEGNKEEMLNRVQAKLGKSKEELFRIMASL